MDNIYLVVALSIQVEVVEVSIPGVEVVLSCRGVVGPYLVILAIDQEAPRNV